MSWPNNLPVFRLMKCNQAEQIDPPHTRCFDDRIIGHPLLDLHQWSRSRWAEYDGCTTPDPSVVKKVRLKGIDGQNLDWWTAAIAVRLFWSLR